MDSKRHETKIKTAIKALWPTIRGDDGVWTRATFEALRDIGVRLGYESLYSAKYKGSGEWLWDFVWLERDPKSGNILSLPLVAESEWTFKKVRYDFEKLLVADAPLRLIILQNAKIQKLEEKFAELELWSLAYHGTPARYLAAGWAYGMQSTYFKSWNALGISNTLIQP